MLRHPPEEALVDSRVKPSGPGPRAEHVWFTASRIEAKRICIVSWGIQDPSTTPSVLILACEQSGASRPGELRGSGFKANAPMNR